MEGPIEEIPKLPSMARLPADVPNGSGLGVDIVEIARMRKIIDRSPAFVEKVYSAAERAYCDSHAHPEVHYATLRRQGGGAEGGTGFSEGIGWLDVEVRRRARGAPYVVLTGRASGPGNRACGRFLLTVLHPYQTPWPAPWPSPRSRWRLNERRRDLMEELPASSRTPAPC